MKKSEQEFYEIIRDPVAEKNSTPWYIWTLFAAGVLAFLMAGVNTVFAGSPKFLEAVYSIDNGSCSAVAIENEAKKPYLLTAYHCITHNNKNPVLDVPVYDKNKKIATHSYVYDIRKRWSKYDLALIELRDKDYKFPAKVSVAKNLKVEVGDTVYAVGFPAGFGVRWFTSGLYNGVHYIERLTRKYDDEVYIATTPIYPGNSGGGLFQKVGNEYELIGTTSRGAGFTEHMNLFVPLDKIHHFLKGYTDNPL